MGSPFSTPRLDRLADEGVVFTTAIAPSTWTLPSVASLMTSLHPSEHGLLGAEEGAEQMPQILDAGLLTMAEAFHDGGYLTAGVINQVYLRYKFGFGQGFDYYDTLRGQDAFRINEKAMEWLDQRDAAAPGAAAPATTPQATRRRSPSRSSSTSTTSIRTGPTTIESRVPSLRRWPQPTPIPACLAYPIWRRPGWPISETTSFAGAESRPSPRATRSRCSGSIPRWGT